MKTHYLIYQVTNLKNNKIYIGKHKTTNLEDSYFGSGKILWQAFDKYGLENFVFKILIDLNNQEEMDLLEELVVNKDFLQRPDVYNCSRGGKNPYMYGKNNPFFGKTHTPERRARIAEKNRNKTIPQNIRDKIRDGVKRSIEEHPERLKRFETILGKKKYTNVETGESKFFKPGEQPEGFEIKIVPVYHVPDEVKAENKKKQSERCKASHWYNNGTDETFCLPDQVPEGYVKGRLPTINVGRKLSDETKNKIRENHLGVEPPNKGKVWITDGSTNKYVSKDFVLEEGWHYGLTRKAKAHEVA